MRQRRSRSRSEPLPQDSRASDLPADMDAFIEEAARLICEEGYADYRAAKHRAAEDLRLTLSPNAVDNRKIELRVLQRQELFGGQEYRQTLLDMRKAGLSLMSLLRDFDPRLAGSCVSGAIGLGHNVQIHVIAEPAESVDIHLINRNIAFEQDERRYRMADGREYLIPLLHLASGDIPADVAVFAEDSRRNPPLSRIDGRPAKRLDLGQLKALLSQADATPIER